MIKKRLSPLLLILLGTLALLLTSCTEDNSPTANDQTLTILEDQAIAFMLSGTDPLDGDPMTFEVVSNPLNGTLTGTAPSLVYTPDPDYNGTDSFAFTVTNADATSAPGTITFNITPVNDTPFAEDDALTLDQGNSKSFTLSATDIDGDNLTYIVVSDPDHGVLSGTAPDLVYTPTASFSGDDDFDFKVNDGVTDSNTATIEFTVNQVADCGSTGSGSILEVANFDGPFCGQLDKNITINSGHVITWDGTNGEGSASTFSGNITIANGGTLQISAAPGTGTISGDINLQGGTFDVDDNIQLTGSITHSVASTIDVLTNTVLTYTGSVINIGTATLTISGGGTLTNSNHIILNNDASVLNLTGANGTINKVSVNTALVSGQINAAADYTLNTLALNDDANIVIGGGQTLSIPTALTVNSDLTASGGTLDLSDSALSVRSDLDLSGLTVNTPDSLEISGNVTLTGLGALNVSSLDLGNYALTLASTSLSVTNAVTFNNAADQIITGTNDLTLIAAPIFTNGAISSTGGTITMPSGSTIGGGTFDVTDSTLVLNGNLDVSATAFSAPDVLTLNDSATLTGAGSITIDDLNFANQTLTLVSTGLSINNAISLASGTTQLITDDNDLTLVAAPTMSSGSITSTGGTVTLPASTTISGGTFDMTDSTLVLNGNLTLTGATFAVPDTLNITTDATLTDAGVISLNTLNLNDSILTLTGSDLTIVNPVTINNGSEGISTGASDLILTGTMSLTSGSIASTGGNLTFSSNISGMGSGSITASGGTVTLSGTPTGGTLNLGGSTLSLNGSLDATNTTFTAPTNLSLPANAMFTDDSALSVSNLTLNDKALTLGTDLTVTNAVTLNNASEQIITQGNDLTLVAAPTLSAGAITSTGGTITLPAATSLGAGTFDLSGSELVLNGNLTLAGTVFSEPSTISLIADATIAGFGTRDIDTLNLNDHALTLSSSNLTVANTVTIDNANERIITGANDLTLSSALDMSNGQLTSSGGTITMSGTVSAGTLDLSSSTLVLNESLNTSGSTLTAPSNLSLTNNAMLTNAAAMTVTSLSLGDNELMLGSDLTVTDAVTIDNANEMIQTGSSDLTLSSPLTMSAGQITSSAGTVTIPASSDVNSGTFDMTNTTLALTGSGLFNLGTATVTGPTALSLGGDTTLSNEDLSVTTLNLNDNALTLSSSNLTVTDAVTINNTAEQIITQGNDLTLVAAPTLSAGAITSTGGTITLPAATSLGAGTLVLSSSELVLNGNLTLAGTAFSEPSTLSLNANATISGFGTKTISTLNLNDNALTLSASSLTVSNPVTLDTSSDQIITGSNDLTLSDTPIFSDGVISSTGGTVTMSGTPTGGTLNLAGSTLSLNGSLDATNTTFTAPTNLTLDLDATLTTPAGVNITTLTLNDNTLTLGSAATDLTVTTLSGDIDIGGEGIVTGDADLSVDASSDITMTAGTLSSSNGAVTLNGSITGGTLSVTGGTITLNGNLTANPTSLSTAGSAWDTNGHTLSLGTTNTFAGDITLSGGTLDINESLSMTGALDVSSDTTLDILSGDTLSYSGGAFNIDSNALTISGGGTLSNAANAIVLNAADSQLITTTDGGTITQVTVNGSDLTADSINIDGTTTISTLSLSNTAYIDIASSKILTITNAMTVPASKNLNLSGTGEITSPSALTVDGTLTLTDTTLDCDNTVTVNSGGELDGGTGILELDGATLNIAGGTFTGGSGAMTLAGTYSTGGIDLSGTTVTLSGNLIFSGTTLTTDASTDFTTGSNTLRWNGVGNLTGSISVNGGTFETTGTVNSSADIELDDGMLYIGGTATLSGQITHTTSSMINITSSSTLNYSHASGLPIGPNRLLVVADASSLLNNSNPIYLDNAGSELEISGGSDNGTINSVDVSADSADIDVNGDITFTTLNLNADTNLDVFGTKIMTITNATTVPASKSLNLSGTGELTTPSALTIDGTLALTDTTLDCNDNVTINSGGVLDGGTGTLELDGATMSNAGTLTGGSGALTMAGTYSSGSLDLSGTTVTLSGNLIFSGTTLTTDASSDFTTGSNTLLWNGSGSLAGSITVNGGAVQISGAGDASADIDLNGALLDIDANATLSGQITQSGDATADIAAGVTLTVSNALTVPASISLGLTGAGEMTTPAALTINGTLALTDTTLDCDNTVTVNSGGELDGGTGTLDLVGATLSVAGGTFTGGSGALTMAGTYSTGSIDLSGTTVTLNGNLIFSGTTLTTDASSDFTTGSNTLRWNGAGTLAGSITVNGGTFETTGTVDTSADIELDDGLLYIGGTTDISGQITHTSSSMIHVTASSTLNYSHGSGLPIGANTLTVIAKASSDLNNSNPIYLDNAASELDISGASENGTINSVDVSADSADIDVNGDITFTSLGLSADTNLDVFGTKIMTITNTTTVPASKNLNLSGTGELTTPSVLTVDGTLTLTDTTLDCDNTVTINSGGELNGGTGILELDGATLNIAGGTFTGGSGALTMAGTYSSGSLDLSGTTVTLSGNLILSGATLTTDASSDFTTGSNTLLWNGSGSLAGSITANGGTFQTTGSADTSADIDLDGGTLDIDANTTISGQITHTSSSTIDIAPSVTLNYSHASGIPIGANTLTVFAHNNSSQLNNSNPIYLDNANSELEIGSAPIGGGIVNAVTVNADLTNPGLIDVDAHVTFTTLDLNATTYLNIASGYGLTVTNAFDVPAAETLYIAETGTLSAGGTVTVTGTLDLDGACTLDFDSGLTVDGAFTGYTGSTVDLASATLTLGGSFDQSDGTLNTDASTDVTLSASATLTSGQAVSISTLTLNDNTLTLGADTTDLTVTTLSGNIDTTGDGIVTGAADLTLTGAITMSNGSLTSSGGTVTLQGAVSGGTLDLTSSDLNLNGNLNVTGSTFTAPTSLTLSTDATFDNESDLSITSLTLGGNVLTMGTGLSVTDPVSVTGSEQIDTGDNDLTLTGAVSLGFGSITSTSGTVSLDSGIASGSTGTMTISGGTVTLSAPTGTFPFGGGLLLAGSSLILNGDLDTTGMGGFSAPDNLALDVDATLTTSAGISINALTLNDNTLTLGSAATDLTVTTISGDITNASEGIATGAADLTLANVLMMTLGTISSTGGTVTFSDGAIFFSGTLDMTDTTVAQGNSLAVNAPTSLTTTGSSWSTNGQTLNLNGPYTFSGDIDLAGGTLDIGQNMTIEGNLDQSSDTSINVPSGATLTYSGADLSIGPNALTFTGGGTISNTGNLILNAADSQLISSTDGGVISLVTVNGADQTTDSINVDGTTTISTLSLSNTAYIDIAGSKILTITNAMTVPASENLNLSGTGEMITPGALIINGTLALTDTTLDCDSTVTINSGGELDGGTGTLDLAGATLSVNSGGTFTGGSGAMTMAGTYSTGNIDLSGTTVTLSGNLIFSGTTLTTDASTDFTTESNTLRWNGVGIPLAGSITVNGGTFETTGTVDASADIELDDGMLYIGGTTTLSGQITHTTSSMINITTSSTLNYTHASGLPIGANRLLVVADASSLLNNSNPIYLDNAGSELEISGGSDNGTINSVDVSADSADIDVNGDITFTTLNLNADTNLDVFGTKIMTITNAMTVPASKSLNLSGTGELTTPSALTIDGTLALTDTTLDCNDNVTINSGGVLDGGTGTLELDGATLSNAGTLTGGSGALTMEGTFSGGSLDLSGTTVTLSGNLIFSGTTLTTDASSDFTTGSNTLLWNGSGSLAGSITVNGGAVQISGAGDASADIDLNGALLDIDANTTLSGQITQSADATADIAAGVTLTVSNALTVPASISLGLTGAGEMVIPSALTVNGTMALASTTLDCNDDVIVNSGGELDGGTGTLDLAGATLSVDGGTLTGGSGALAMKGTYSTGVIDLSGTTVTATDTLNFNGTTLTTDASTDFTTGSNTLRWNGSGTLAGSITVSTGGLFQADGTWSSGADFVLDGGRLFINGNITISGQITLTTNSMIQFLSGTLNYTNANGIPLGARTLTVVAVAGSHLNNSNPIYLDSASSELDISSGSTNGTINSVDVSADSADIDANGDVTFTTLDINATTNLDIASGETVSVTNAMTVPATKNMNLSGTGELTTPSPLTINGTLALTGTTLDCNDDVIVNSGGELNGGTGILELDGATLSVAGGTFTGGSGSLTMEGTYSSGSMDLSGTTVTQSGNLIFSGTTLVTDASSDFTTGSHALLWDGSGTLAGSITINGSGSLQTSGTADSSADIELDGGTLYVNSGTTTISGLITHTSSSAINLLSSTTLNYTHANGLSIGANTLSVTNAGGSNFNNSNPIYLNDASSDLEIFAGPVSGTINSVRVDTDQANIDVNSNITFTTLDLNATTYLDIAGGTQLVTTNAFDIPTAKTLYIAGTGELYADGTITVTGTLDLNGACTLDINSSLTVNGSFIDYTGSTVDLTGATLTLGANFDQSDGNLTTSSTNLTITDNITLTSAQAVNINLLSLTNKQLTLGSDTTDLTVASLGSAIDHADEGIITGIADLTITPFLSMTLGTLSSTGGNVIFDGGGNIASGSLTLSGGIIHIYNNLTVAPTSLTTSSAVWSTNGNTLTINGAYTFPANILLSGGTLDIDESMTISGDISVSSASTTIDVASGKTLTYSGSATSFGSTTMTIAGGGIIANANAFNMTATDSVFHVTGSGGSIQNLSAAANLQSDNINIDGDFTITNLTITDNLDMAIASGATLTITNTVTVPGATTLSLTDAGTLATNGALTLTGAMILTAAGTLDANDTLNANNTLTVGTGTLDISSATLVLGDDLDTSTGTLTTDASTDIGLSQNATLTSGQALAVDTLSLSNYTLTLGSATTDMMVDNSITIFTGSEGVITGDADLYLISMVAITAGQITSSGGTITLSAGGTVNSSGTFDVSGSTLALGGNLTTTGATFTTDSSTDLTIVTHTTLTSDQAVSVETLTLNNQTLTLGSTATDLTVAIPLTINSGTEGISTGAADLTLSSALTSTTGGGSITSTSGIIELNSGGTVTSGTLDISGSVLKLGGSLDVTGATFSHNSSSELVLTGDSTLTGAGSVSISSLGLGNSALTLGTGTTSLTVASAIADFDATGDQIITGSNDLTLNAVLSMSAGSITSTGGTITLSADATADSSAILDVSGSSLILGGDLNTTGATFTTDSSTDLNINNAITLTSDQAVSVETLTLNNQTLTLGSATSDLTVTSLGGSINSVGEGINTGDADLYITPILSMSAGTLSSTGGTITFDTGSNISGGAFDMTDSTVDVDDYMIIAPTTLVTSGSTWDTSFYSMEINGAYTFEGDISKAGGTLYINDDVTMSGNISMTASSTLDVTDDATLTYTGSTISIGDATLTLSGGGYIDNNNPISLSHANSVLLLTGTDGMVKNVSVDADLSSGTGSIDVDNDFVIFNLSLTGAGINAVVDVVASKTLIVGEKLSTDITGFAATLTVSGSGTFRVHDIVLDGSLDIIGTVTLCPDSTLEVLTSSTFAPGQDLTFYDGVVVADGATLTINDSGGPYTIVFAGGVTIGTGQIVLAGDENLEITAPGPDATDYDNFTNSGTGDMNPASSGAADVLAFAASPGNGYILLAWEYQDPSNDSIMIRRSTTSYPADTSSDTLVYEGTKNYFYDDTASGVANNIKYYYTAFAYDSTNDYSGGVRATATATVEPENLAAYLQFSGNLNTEDSSGRANHAEDYAGTDSTSDIHGVADMAYNFDGTDGHLEMDNPLANDFTISFWLRTSQTTGSDAGQWYNGKAIIDGRIYEYSDDFGVAIGNSKILFGTGDSGADDTLLSTETIADGAWHHVAVTRKETGGIRKIYIDGQLDTDDSTHDNVTLGDAFLLRIGATPFTDNHYQGDLDEIRLYTRVLEEHEIHKLYSFHQNLLLPHSGQTNCYDVSGDEITCPAAGAASAQDGSYVKNQLSFTDTGGGAVIDNVTNLMWQQSDDNSGRNWSDAGTYCADLTTDSYSDWRLPTISELVRLTNYGTRQPAIDDVFYFTNSTWYWSGTEDALNAGNSWLAGFGEGLTTSSAQSSNCLVRCVRNTAIAAAELEAGTDVVIDRNTGLTWQRSDYSGTYNWENAITYCEDMTTDSRTDWRLPNVKELQSIVDYDATSDPVIGSGFTDTDSNLYWTATSTEAFTDRAFLINFNNGETLYFNKQNTLKGVRCVRGGLISATLPAGEFGISIFGAALFSDSDPDESN